MSDKLRRSRRVSLWIDVTRLTTEAAQKRVIAEHRAPVAQLVEHRAVTWEVVSSTPAGTNTQGLKITE